MRILASGLLCLFMFMVVGPVRAQDRQPNVVVILADDMGWNDIGYHGSEIATPTLDELAQTGVRLNHFYTQPTCSPTRASLMTGQSAVRLGIRRPLNKSATRSLPLDIRIMPQYFRDEGYQTVHIGKWHLGDHTRAMLPNARGFDYSYGYFSGGIGYWNHIHGGGHDWNRNGEDLREEGYATRLLAEDAVRQIKQRDKSRPLFLYLALPAPHLPNEAPEETIAHYERLDNPFRRIHAAMVEELDTAIGQVVRTLEEEGIRDNTLIWFSSDNGGLNAKAVTPAMRQFADGVQYLFGAPAPFAGLEFIRNYVLESASDNGPLRRGKGSVYEGGVRVPAFVNWPGKLNPGTEVDERITIQDVLPTLAGMLDFELAPDHMLDGSDQWSKLQGKSGSVTPDFVISGYAGLAYFSGSWKLVPSEEGYELYDLLKDPYEENDLAALHPDVVADLTARLEAFPKAESNSTSTLGVLFDPDTFGGPEYSEPWADLVLDD